MEYTNKAIGLACEKGGYSWKVDVTLESMLLDPKWWQALGKAEGWETKIEYFRCPSSGCSNTQDYLTYKHCPLCGKSLESFYKTSTNWQKEIHRFIDHLASGKSTESFFEGLLAKK